MDDFLSSRKSFNLKPQLMMCWCSKIYHIIYVWNILNRLKKKKNIWQCYKRWKILQIGRGFLWYLIYTLSMDLGFYCVSFLKFPEEDAAEGKKELISQGCNRICREQHFHTVENCSQNFFKVWIFLLWCPKAVYLRGSRTNNDQRTR